MIILIKAVIISYVLSSLGKFLGDLLSLIDIKNKIFKLIVLLLTYVLSCPSCFSMWFSLILTGDLFYAAITSLVIKVIDHLENKYNKTKLH